MRAAWLRLQKRQQLMTIEAMHATKPSELYAALMAEMAPHSVQSPFQQLLDRAQPAATS